MSLKKTDMQPRGRQRAEAAGTAGTSGGPQARFTLAPQLPGGEPSSPSGGQIPAPACTPGNARSPLAPPASASLILLWGLKRRPARAGRGHTAHSCRSLGTAAPAPDADRQRGARAQTPLHTQVSQHTRTHTHTLTCTHGQGLNQRSHLGIKHKGWRKRSSSQWGVGGPPEMS